MSPQQIVAVAARLFAVLVALGLPAQIYAFWTLTLSSGAVDPGLRLLTAATLLLAAIVALVLWFFPLTVAHKLLSRTPDAAPPPSSADTWLAMGCALIGLWMFATTLPSLLNDAEIALSTSDGAIDVWRPVIFHVINLAIAIWLILGAKGFIAVFRWAQNAGVRKESP